MNERTWRLRFGSRRITGARKHVHVIVIGAGAAGAAAAWRARRGGVDVTVVHDTGGSTSLYSGALDLREWEHASFPASLDPDSVAFATALGAWTLKPAGGRIATRSGVIRPAAGMDSALLELGSVAGRRVAVADFDRDDWDAPLLARALSDTSWARSSRTRFEPVRIAAIKKGHERRIAPSDFAALHDEPERMAHLVDELKRASAGYDAWLVGSFLGTRPETVDNVRRAVRMPIGEPTSAPGGPAGARFEMARDRLFETSGIAVRRDRVIRVSTGPSGVSVELAGREAVGASLGIDGDLVVIAAGGVAAGGVVLGGTLLERGAFELSFTADVDLELDGRLLDAASSLFGVDLQASGLETLTRVGIAVDGPRVRGSQRLLAAGDVVAARPRTVLEGVRAGVAAGKLALG